MKRTSVVFAVLAVLLCGPWRPAAADMVWETPVGTIGLPFEATEMFAGYDAVLKQAVGGASLPVYTDPKGFVALQVGAAAPWPVGNQASVQPYLALGHDVLREIPVLAEYRTLHLNVFGRYVPSVGKAGVGLSFSWSFLGAPVAPTAASPVVEPVVE